ncbi:unnamed protein product [Caenorhabditis auriculariae]|uniref:Uncharacterized protein n=1 Tax=Caenorhabditis auriculariae TaxID=2777116 RepID=A0A8S1HU62_9PELO|nr:unnamed protein product [Caenorhabditis auriculariae]
MKGKSSSASPPSERVVVERRPGTSSVDLVDSNHFDVPGPSRCSETPSSAASGSTSLLSTSSTSGTSLAMCSTTLSPPSPGSASAQSTPSLSVSTRVVHSTSMQFGSTITAPKSPKTTRLVHAIPHKWHRSTKFRFSGDAVCHFCQRPLGFGFLNAWEKCRSCRWKVHTQCKSRVGDSCGLTPEHLRFLFDKLIKENNGGMWGDPQSAAPLPSSRSMNETAFQYPDASIDSSSSTNSSAPSTPALPLGVASSPYNPLTAPYRTDNRKFFFPDASGEQLNILPTVVISAGETAGDMAAIEDAGEGRIGEGSEGTLILVDSSGSGTDSGDANSKSPDLRTGHNWDRNTWNMSTIRGPNAQASWNEVTIPFQKIELNKKIGNGRFGEVLQGYYFGDVAVKMLDMDHIEENKRLDEFKTEVSGHKNTRHDNIVLFLGFCIDDGNFGIVMSLCRGRSLFSLIHEHRERIDMATVLSIAQQICQGVSYLHTKKILHKDLRSKNVFLESKNKVVITDFGIFSMKRLRVPKVQHGFMVPSFWLSYLAPELVRAITPQFDELPFSESSDVFSFGTIWYELVTGSLPMQKEPWQRTLWMVGQGLKAAFRNVDIPRDMKDIISRCCNAKSTERPSFSDIQNLLATFPKPRVDRSPSFPMLRSHESKF